MDPRELATQKVLTMERHISYLRALVIGLNVVVYLVFMRDRPRAGLAWTVIVVATVYALWSLLARPYERYPLLRFGLGTLIADNALILMWILGTGSIHSEFWVIYFISVVSVAMRYDLYQTLLAAGTEATAYTLAMLVEGGMVVTDSILRAAYILLCGLASGLLARQERISREERVHYAALAEREAATAHRLEELNALKTTFIANAAHELRTPLTTIFGSASTLANRFESLDPDGVRSLLDATLRQGQRIRMLLDNLLDMSQLDRDSMTLELAACDVRATVETVLEVAPAPADKTVRLEIPESLSVLADQLRLEQVLTNLVVNAHRYGGSTITVRARRAGARVEIDVLDDGDGVPTDLLSRLFEPFSRGDNSARQIGSGLGLALSRRMVLAFGGALSYDREDGRSCFRVSLIAAGAREHAEPALPGPTPDSTEQEARSATRPGG